MSRSRFDHLAAEVSVAVGSAIPRYPLWLHVHECGIDPEAMSCEEVVDFCNGSLQRFLFDRGLWLSPRERRRLLRSLRSFDPARTRPADQLVFNDS